MGKNDKVSKRYKSTSFVPSGKGSLSQADYQKLVMKTLHEKLPYFVIGLGVLLGLAAGISYVLIKSAPYSTVAINKPQKMNTIIVSPSVTPSVTPVKKVNKTLEIAQKPKVDLKKAAEAAAAKPGTVKGKYVVKAGDTLWKIAEQTYKSGFNYKSLVAYNKLANPNVIHTGDVIVLPEVAPFLPTDKNTLAQGGVGGPSVPGEIGEGAMTSEVTNTDTSYTVVKGDTLWSIAERTYGDGFSWRQIAKVNGVEDPLNLEPGTVLQIPR